MNLKCVVGFHEWAGGCKCSNCGKFRYSGVNDKNLSLINRHLEIASGFDTSLEPDIAKALRENPSLNKDKSMESLSHAIAWDVQCHCELSAYRVADAWQRGITAAFKKWYESRNRKTKDKELGALLEEVAFNVLKTAMFLGERPSRMYFNMLLKEWPNTALRPLVYGTLGTLSFMSSFTVDRSEKDKVEEDAKRNLDMAISLSEPDASTLPLWMSVRSKL